MSLLADFKERLLAVDGHPHGPMTAGQAKMAALDLAGSPGIYLAWDDLGLPGVREAFDVRGWRRLHHEIGNDRFGRQTAMASVRLGLTGADGAIARSGSIVLRSGPGRPRMASLIPLIHIAFVPVASLRSTLSEFGLASMDPSGASNVVVITGPSRTGDIEQQLNLGVHGPKELHVILVE